MGISNQAKIHVFLRSCPESEKQNSKYPDWFSKKEVFDNFLRTTDFEQARLTVFFDGNESSLFSQRLLDFPIVYGHFGTDRESYRALVEHVYNMQYADDDILYFLEDDYLHRPGWTQIMTDGFRTLNAGILTLYDHPDKYHSNAFKFLQSGIRLSSYCHWRTIPSTTNTFAIRAGLLKKHIEVFRNYWLDHEKFMKLWSEGVMIMSSIPAYATHCNVNCESPLHDWKSEL